MPTPKYEFYETSRHSIDQLFRYHPFVAGRKTILEPCSGDGAITKYLTEKGMDVVTNDLDVERTADFHHDAGGNLLYEKLKGIRFDAIVTNPPYKEALQILTTLFTKYPGTLFCLHLRLTFLEPTREREPFLIAHPPDRLIVLPRASFSGDGKTDSVTGAWMIWNTFGKSIHVAPRKRT